MTTARELALRLHGKRNGDGWMALCPAHEDRKPSLSISEGEGEGGKVLTHCHAGCTPEQVWSALRLGTNESARREIAAYDYRDENEKPRYQCVRFEPKDFRQRRPDGQGGWIWNLNGTPRVLYRLPELLASKPAQTVLVVEGEKDADRLAHIGLVATTNSGGAGKWRDEYNKALRDRKVVVLTDNDEPGRKHAAQVATSLLGVAASVKVVELPGVPEKGDVSDWLDAGGSVADLRTLANNAAEFEIKSGKSVSRICSAEELLTRVFAEIRWAVLNLLPEGVIIFAGSPKLGKSWLALNIAVAVACGGRALGAVPVEAGDVLYLALEDGPRRLQERLRITLAGGETPQTLFLATEWPRFDDGGLDAIRVWLEEHPNGRLIVIDTLKRVRPIEHQRARLYDGDYDAIGPLGDMARAHGCAVLVVHHTRKMFSPDPLDLVSGSLGLTGAADGVLVLKRARGEPDATLHASGRDFEDKEIALRWDKELLGWRMLGDAAEFQRSNERRDVIELLRKQPSLTPKVISETLGRKHSATKKLLWSMAREGELHADNKGRYSLIQSNGRAAITEDVIYFPPGASDEEIDIIAAEREAIAWEGATS